MPGLGLDNAVVGYAAFCTVKFAGYALASWVICGRYKAARVNPWLAGGARTLIGMVVGGLYFFGMQGVAWGRMGPHPELYFGLLFPLRLGEWWLLVYLFFDRPLQQVKRDWIVAVVGTLWSYFLDIPAVFGLLATGGFSVC